MWLPTRFALCARRDLPTVVFGGEAYGAPFLLAHAREEEGTLAWVALGPPEAGDPVAAGNRLATALNETVGGELFPHAVPYAFHLEAFRRHRTGLAPFRIAVSGAERAPDLAARLAALHTAEHPVLIVADGLAEPTLEGPLAALAAPGAAHRVTVERLRLTRDEALDLAPRRVPDEEVERLLAETDGAYTRFLADLHARAGLPAPLVPSGDGPLLAPGEERLEDPADVLEALTRLERWTDALEIAAEHLPHEVEALLGRAGPAYQQSGLLDRLDLILRLLPRPLQLRERTLEWRLVAAHHAGRPRDVLQDIRRHLETHEAPELRARFAAYLPAGARLEQARRAAEARPTPLTLWQLGRLTPDHGEGAEVLLRSVRAAESEGDANAAARAAGSLADRYSHAGDFEAAATWGRWALGTFDAAGLRDGPRRLRLHNALQFARLMSGDLVDLARPLEETFGALEAGLPQLARTYRSTLAQIALATGDPDAAASLTLANLEEAPRAVHARFAVEHVRALLELDRVDDALAVASAASILRSGEVATPGNDPELALGMALAFRDPGAALPRLRRVLGDETARFEDRACAALHLLLAAPDAEGDVPEPILERLASLPDSALAVLAGPPHRFHAVRERLRGGHEAPELELRALGRPRARFRGEEVKLSKRRWEALLAIALHPGGLSYEELHAFLLRDEPAYSAATLRSHVSHLRGLLPVSDTPYRIEVPYVLDLAQALEHLAAGRVRDAAALAAGPLLPQSDAPGVREAREQFEGALREALLESGDADALHAAAQRWPDDLEVWEAARAHLPPGDPRRPLVAARIRRLERDYA